ncbi:MAG TPA: AMP-binding protein, partial [Tabrizicola sp.]|nr:AMP-binding protein [Tabrizicola sp.]
MSRAPIGFEAIGLAVSPYDLLQRQAQLWPDHALLVLPEAVRQLWGLDRLVWTYREVRTEVDHLAAGYASAGYGVGHRVALLFENRPQHFLHWFALNSLGVSIVPLNPDYRADELRYALTHSAACLIVTVPTCLA